VAEITEKIGGVPGRGIAYALARFDPRRLDAAFQPFVLVELSTVVGRDPRQAGLFVDDPAVSRQHVCLRFVPRRRRFEVIDLGSSNGLLVNGERVNERVVAPNDVLRIGGQIFLFVELNDAGLLRSGVLEERCFEGTSAEVRQANALLDSLPEGGRALLAGEPGVGKAEAIRRLARRLGASERLRHVHGTSLRDSAWEGALVRWLEAAAQDGVCVVHFDDLALAPREAQERLEFLLRSEHFERERGVTTVVTLRSTGRTAASVRLTPGLITLLAPPYIRISPLRSRRLDVVPTLLSALAGRGRRAPVAASVDFVEALLLHAWPGNGGEVRALVDQLASSGRVEATFNGTDLPGRLLPCAGNGDPSNDSARVVAALRASRGNMSAAARSLGLSRRHVYRLVERYGLEASAYRPGATSTAEPT
jgi:pSer/pThr/pTyr-binding forkhead associated (FHA) protein